MPDQDQAKAYWDRVAGKKTFTVSLPVKQLTALVPPAASILDFGCGYGRSLTELAALGYRHLAGCDFSPRMIELARQQIPDAELKVNEGVTVPFADHSYDAVLLLAVLTGVTADADQAALMTEIRRVLRPGGLLMVGDFLLNDDDRNLERYRQAVAAGYPYGVFNLPEEGATLRHHDRAYLRLLLSGFTQLDYWETVHTTMNGHRSNGFYYFGRLTAGAV